MTNIQKKECHKIIHLASASASLAGGVSLSISDRLLITPIQVGMAIKLAKIFGIKLGETAASTLLTSGVASSFGKAVSQAILGRIPVLGNVVNASTAAVITEAMGWAIVKEFDSGEIVGNLLLVKDAIDN